MSTKFNRLDVAVLATLDTKEEEAAFLVTELRRRGLAAVLVDTAPSAWVAQAGADRSALVAEAAEAIAGYVESLLPAGLEAVVVVGGATGAALGCPSFRRLPLGLAKVLVSPVASGETAEYVGDSDAVLIAPVVDFVGRNAYADFALERAAVVVAALVRSGGAFPQAAETHLAVTAFGVTSPLVAQLQRELQGGGRSAVVFSATGTGGEAYERFIRDGLVHGALDITTSEVADELCGGVLAARPGRLTAAAESGLPQVVMPGGLDFINFREPAMVPARFANRAQVHHTPVVTLVRTSAEENELFARTIAARVRGSERPATFVLPLQGFSLLSAPGGPFADADADAAFIETLKAEVGSEHAVIEIDAPINSPDVATAILEEVSSWAPAPVV